MKYKIILDKKIWLLLLFSINIMAIIIRYMFLTDKFFNDSLDIISIERSMDLINLTESGSFIFAAKIFYYINFFEIDNLLEWSIYISIIFFLIKYSIFKNIKKIEVLNFFILLIGIFLWYLFAVGITKEIIQTVFYLMMYFFINNDNIFKFAKRKIFVCIIILGISAIVFREYYILIAFFSLIIYLINIFVRKRQLNGISNYIYMMVLFLFYLYIFLILISYVFPFQYERIINLRVEEYKYLLDMGTNSFIDNIILGNNIYIYILNYIINYFRLLIPIELIFIGKIYYIPYIIYQCMFTYIYIKNICNLNNINDKKFVSIIFLTSFIFVSVIIEPDFGSWIRHQSACYMLLIILLKD